MKASAPASPDRYRYHYHVYGLLIAANSPIPALAADSTSPGRADIRVDLGAFPKPVQQRIEQGGEVIHSMPGWPEETPPNLVVRTLDRGRYFYFRYLSGHEFVIDRHATHILGRWPASSSLDECSFYLPGPILGFALRLRNITCLHASGVVTGGVALACGGESGAGKSTLAAHFAAAGHAVLSDDVLPLTLKKGAVQAVSGYRRLRLFPASCAHHANLPDELPRLTEGWDKRYLELTRHGLPFHQGSAPLRAIYLLDWSRRDGPVRIEPLSATEALPLLAANSRRIKMPDPAMRRQAFLFLGHLVREVPVRKLFMVDDLQALPELMAAILEDFRRLSPSPDRP